MLISVNPISESVVRMLEGCAQGPESEGGPVKEGMISWTEGPKPGASQVVKPVVEEGMRRRCVSAEE